MPFALRLRLRRVVVAASVCVLGVGLAACGMTPLAPAESPAVLIQHADQDLRTARVVPDDRTDSIAIVPARRNGALVVFLHGWGESEYTILERPNEVSVTRALVLKGYVVVAEDAGGEAWGDAASVADYRSLITSTSRRYGLRSVFLMGESMGGLATMQLARALPDVRAVVAWYPVCDLRTMHEARFQPSIRSAWLGVSRAPVSPVRVGDVPMMVWASPHDTVVRAAANAARCVAEAHDAGATVSYVHTVGQHGDPSNFVPNEVLDFFSLRRAPAV